MKMMHGQSSATEDEMKDAKHGSDNFTSTYETLWALAMVAGAIDSLLTTGLGIWIYLCTAAKHYTFTISYDGYLTAIPSSVLLSAYI